jgi:hypothetical protein
VKLLSRDDASVVFLIGKRERQMLLKLLERYPVLTTAHHHATHGSADHLEETEQLLREALGEQQKQIKQLLRQMLAEPERFVENDLGFKFTVKPGELEWLLQVLNDVRIGSWVQLGAPTPENQVQPPLNEENVQLAWAIEIAGLFESALLEALATAD